MSSPNIKASMLNGSGEKNSTFIPKEQISLSYGKSTVYVYPPIVEGMSNAEKSYAYMTNKAAISTADINPKTKLQAFGHSMGCTALVNVMQTSFVDHALKWIFQPPDSLSTLTTLAPDGSLLALRNLMGSSRIRRMA